MVSTKQQSNYPEITRISLDSLDTITIHLNDTPPFLPELDDIQISPYVRPKRVTQLSKKSIRIQVSSVDYKKSYRLNLFGNQEYPVLPDGVLNRFHPVSPLGLTWDNNSAIFRLFGPRLKSAEVVLFHAPHEEPFDILTMSFDTFDGTWEVSTDHLKRGDFYGYRVIGPKESGDISNIIFADPFSLAVTRTLDWPNRALSIAIDKNYLQSESRNHVNITSADLLIYEAHLKDVSNLSKSLDRSIRGKFAGAFHPESDFFKHYQQLGFNAIEWLPLQDFDYNEPPFNEKKTPNGNHWNQYSFNHWGYMTSHFFAPSPRYATKSEEISKGWIGTDGRQIFEMQNLVKAIHSENSAVIMDVVYNHVAQYGQTALRLMDPLYYLRHDRDGNPTSYSGCGNDFDTARPVNRKLIVESLKHWSTFYGVDGFRFDLAGLIDDDTLDVITSELKDTHPEIHLIAEPWGGIYDKERFNRRGWASWNDIFRDGIRGFHPDSNRGFIFGSTFFSIEPHVRGCTKEDHGPYNKECQSINFVACHDGYTLGDFIRIATNIATSNKAFKREKKEGYSKQERSTIALALFILITSRGIPMLHQGDEWGNSKRIRAKKVKDPKKGFLDHDSYNKDDETNWIDWEMIGLNDRRLLIHYIGELVRIRKKHAAFRLSQKDNMTILEGSNGTRLGYRLIIPNDEVLVLLNASPHHEAIFNIPKGKWSFIVNGLHADSSNPITGVVEKKAAIPPKTGAILVPVTS